jgi:curli biogenesis system outer membrane secretion channel CsgG
MKILYSLKWIPFCVILIAQVLAAVGCEEEKRVKLTYEKELAVVKTYAVLPFVDAPGPRGKGSGNVVVNAIIAELYRCRGVRVVERSQINKILTERDFNISQLDSDKATRLGKLAGADAVIFGEVNQYAAQQEYSHGAVYVVSSGGTKHMHRVGLYLRVVDVKTGQVLYAEGGQGQDKEGFLNAAKIAAGEAIKPLRDFYDDINSPKPPKAK